MIREEIRLSRHIKRSFVLAVTLLVSLAIINLYITSQRVQMRESDSKIINLSGKQRMYSQKVAKDALLVQTAPDSAALHQRIGELKRDLVAWQSVYDALRITGEDSRKIEQLIYLHKPHRDAMLDAVQQIIHAAQLPDSTQQNAAIREATQLVLVHEPFVLHGRDEITRQYTFEANAALAKLSDMLSITTLATVAVLMLQAFFLFRPLEKLIRNFVRRQSEQIEELHQQQQELRAIHDKLSTTNAFQHALLQNAVASIISSDENGVITSINQATTNWLGYQPEELIGKHTGAVFHLPEEVAQRAAALSSELGERVAPDEVFIKKVTAKQSETREWTYVRKDGSTFAILLTLSAITDVNGVIKGYLSVGIDITEKNKIETERRKNEQLYRLLSENTRDVIRLHRLDGTYEYVSPSVLEMLGYTPEELTGTNPMQIIHPADRERVIDFFRHQVTQQFASGISTYRLIRKDGDSIWVETVSKPVIDATGGLQYIQTSSRDISKRKQAEEQVRNLSEQLSGVLDSSLSGIMAFRSVRNEAGLLIDFEWVQVNVVAEQLVGRTSAELLGRHLLQEMPGNREEGLFDRYVQVVETGEPLNLEHYYEHEGLKTWFLIAAVKLADGFAVTFSDITDRKQAEIELHQAYQELQVTEEELRSRGEELQSMNEMMEQTIHELRTMQSQLIQSEKMASLGQLTAGIAHEINNPINFVYAGVDNLKQSLQEIYQVLAKYEAIEKLQSATQITEQLAAMPHVKQQLFYEENKANMLQTIDSIQNGAFRTAEIVKGLRNFSRLGEAAVKYANIHEGIDSTLVLLASQIKNRITVLKHYAPDFPEIECYPGQLNQVFMNILSNAAQAIEEKGEITIRTENLPETINIYLQDTGSGMSAETQAKIFDPFFTTKPVGQGTGLGLSISYSIIQKHQGKIRVSSEPGVGTTFIITLPKRLSE